MSPPEPGRILLVRLSHLGDVVHALPVFHALRRRWPAAKLAWICQKEFAPLLAGLPGLDLCLLFNRGGGLRGLWRARRDMAAAREVGQRTEGVHLLVHALKAHRDALAARLLDALG